MLLFFVAIILKLSEIQFKEGDKYRAKSSELTLKQDTIFANKGNVYAEDGSLLATSMSRYDIRMDAVTVANDLFEENIQSLSRELSKMFGKSSSYYESLIRKGRKNKNRYLLIARGLSYLEYQKIKSFPIFNKGVYKGGFIAEQSTIRAHPLGKVAERTIGYDDYRGAPGIEGAYKNYLRGSHGWRMKQKISKGQWKPINDNNEVEPKDGRDVITTIDVNIQDVAHHALLEQLEKYEADHGCVVVMETKTGEIKAISNLGRTSQGKYYEKRNYAVYESHETGSTFKLMDMVIALEDKVIDTGTVVDTEKGVITIHRRKVRDSHSGGYGEISAARAFEVSSNVGLVKIIYENYKDNPKRFTDYLDSFGLNKKIGLPIKGEGMPIIPHPSDKNWSKISLPWMAFGYGVSLTPLQTLTFYNAIANDGEMVKPRFIKEIRGQNKVEKVFDKEVINKKICSQETIDKVKELLKNVIVRGTGQGIYSPDYSLAGKTGTCQTDYWIPDAPLQYISSFVGFFPVEKPMYSCIVVIHKPNKEIGYYGADVTGPVFKKIALKIYSNKIIIDNVSNKDPKLATIDNNYKSFYEASKEVHKTMPNVVGMTGMDAISLLENIGLKVKMIGIGKVKNQSVKKGEQIIKGSTVIIETS